MSKATNVHNKEVTNCTLLKNTRVCLYLLRIFVYLLSFTEQKDLLEVYSLIFHPTSLHASLFFFSVVLYSI